MKYRLLNHPAIFLALFTLGWAVIEPLGGMAGVSSYQVVWTRYGVHLAFMLLVFGPRQRTALVHSQRWGRQIARALMMVTMPLCFIWAMQRMAANDVMTIFWIAPALVILVAVLTGEESGGVRTVIAIGCGFLGSVLIYRPDAGVFHPSAVLAFGMAASLAIYIVMTRAMHEEALMAKLFHTALWVFLPFTFILPFVWHPPTSRGLAAMIGIGLIGWVALYALDRAVDTMPPARLAPVLYTQLAWIVLLHWPLDIMSLGARTLLGTVLALIAAIPAFLWRSPHDVQMLGNAG